MSSRFVCAMLLLCAAPVTAQDFTFVCSDFEFQVDSTIDQLEFTLPVHIWGPGAPMVDSQGFSMGLAHDPTALNVLAVDFALPFTPDFFQEFLHVGGWSAGTIYAFLGGVFVTFPDPVAVLDVTYETVPGYLTGATQVLELTFDELGVPPVENVVVVAGAGSFAALDHGSVTFGPGSFQRGDLNADTVVDISDAVAALSVLFIPETDPPICMKSADVNDDSNFDVSDAVFLLSSLFVFGAPDIPEPTICGVDPTDDVLPCAEGCL